MPIAPVADGFLEFHVAGEGFPVVMLHGALMDTTLDPLCERLSADWQVIRYSRRGYSDSSVAVDRGLTGQVEDAVLLVRHLGHESVHVVGYSYGSAIAMEWLRQAAETLNKVVLVDPVFPNDVPAGAEFWVAAPAAVAAGHTGSGRGFVEAICAALGPENWRELVAALGPAVLDHAGEAIDVYTKVELPSLRGWRVPISASRQGQARLFVVSGGDSPALFRESAALLESLLPKANFKCIPGATHFLPFSHTEAVATLIGDLLGDPAPPSNPSTLR